MIPIPQKLKTEIFNDPEYKDCMLRDYPNHVCEGRKDTKEHAIIYAGQRLQKKWAIISICAKAHQVDEFQDAHTMNKELNVWVALNRATDQELREVSKAIDYIRERDRLNKKYGPYISPIVPKV